MARRADPEYYRERELFNQIWPARVAIHEATPPLKYVDRDMQEGDWHCPGDAGSWAKSIDQPPRAVHGLNLDKSIDWLTQFVDVIVFKIDHDPARFIQSSPAYQMLMEKEPLDRPFVLLHYDAMADKPAADGRPRPCIGAVLLRGYRRDLNLFSNDIEFTTPIDRQTLSAYDADLIPDLTPLVDEAQSAVLTGLVFTIATSGIRKIGEYDTIERFKDLFSEELDAIKPGLDAQMEARKKRAEQEKRIAEERQKEADARREQRRQYFLRQIAEDLA